MTRPSVTFHEATPDRVEAYLGQRPAFTFRGHVAMIDDRVVGLGGISYVAGMPWAFSQMADELRARRKDVARCVRFLERYLGTHKGSLFAVACEPTSPGLLRRLGFVATGQTLAEGPVMVRANV